MVAGPEWPQRVASPHSVFQYVIIECLFWHAVLDYPMVEQVDVILLTRGLSCETTSSLSIAAAFFVSRAPQPLPALPCCARASLHKLKNLQTPIAGLLRTLSFSNLRSLNSRWIVKTACRSPTVSPATQPSSTEKTWASNSAQSSAVRVRGNSRFSLSKQLTPPRLNTQPTSPSKPLRTARAPLPSRFVMNFAAQPSSSPSKTSPKPKATNSSPSRSLASFLSTKATLTHGLRTE